MQKKPTKPKTKKKKRRNYRDFMELKIDQKLLKYRQIMLFSEINQQSAKEVVEKLFVFDQMSDKPITLWINSGGGSVDDGYAIIDVMRQARSPIITLIAGSACSMAAMISIAGDLRTMTQNSTWMAHDIASFGMGDYITKVADRTEYLTREQTKGEEHLREYTKLSEKNIEKARHGELWLYPDVCLKKGIIDEIIQK